MFSGKKEHLRPIYDALLKLGLGIGKKPKPVLPNDIVPLYPPSRVCANQTDDPNAPWNLGLSLGSMKTPKRLIDTGVMPKKNRITHRVEITSTKEIDDEVKRWLKVAYDRDA